MHFLFRFNLRGKALHFCPTQTQVIEDITFVHFAGLEFKRIQLNDDSPHEFELSGLFCPDKLSEDDLRDDVAADIFVIRKQKLHLLYSCIATSLKCNDRTFLITLASRSWLLNKNVTNYYTRTCKAEFCGTQCGLNLNDYIKRYAVVSCAGKKIFLANAIEAGFFAKDALIFGRKYPIEQAYDNIVELAVAAPQTETVALIPDCDKRFSTCCNKYGNALNFRGELFIPQDERIIFVDE